MPIVWIGRINAPGSVERNMPFQISWDIWYIKWPFQKIRVISRISWDSESHEKIHAVRPWWFIGRVRTTSGFSGIGKTTAFTISAGYRQ